MLPLTLWLKAMGNITSLSLLQMDRFLILCVSFTMYILFHYCSITKFFPRAYWSVTMVHRLLEVLIYLVGDSAHKNRQL